MKVRYSQSDTDTVHTRWGEVGRGSTRKECMRQSDHKTEVFTFNSTKFLVGGPRIFTQYRDQYTQEIYLIIQPEYMECSLIFSILLKFLINFTTYMRLSPAAWKALSQKNNSLSVQRAILMWVPNKGISWNEKREKEKWVLMNQRQLIFYLDIVFWIGANLAINHHHFICIKGWSSII